MSLTVSLYCVTPDGRFDYVPYNPAPPYSDLGGFERWRTTVYGSERARALGLKLLPTLADGNIYAMGDDLRLLAREVEALKADYVREAEEEGIEQDCREGHDALLRRLDNILEAVRVALDSKGRCGVCIEKMHAAPRPFLLSQPLARIVTAKS